MVIPRAFARAWPYRKPRRPRDEEAVIGKRGGRTKLDEDEEDTEEVASYANET